MIDRKIEMASVNGIKLTSKNSIFQGVDIRKSTMVGQQKS